MSLLHIRTFQGANRGNCPGKYTIRADTFSHNDTSHFLQVSPGANQKPAVIPQQLLCTSTGRQTARLDVIQLDQVVFSLYLAGLTQFTQKTYAAGMRRCMEFCKKISVVPLPTIESSYVCYFVAYLREEFLKHRTVKSYLSAK